MAIIQEEAIWRKQAMLSKDMRPEYEDKINQMQKEGKGKEFNEF